MKINYRAINAVNDIVKHASLSPKQVIQQYYLV